MDKLPHVVGTVTYWDSSKKNLKEWIWKTFRGTFNKDHSIEGQTSYIGFWTKAGTSYYAVMFTSKG